MISQDKTCWFIIQKYDSVLLTHNNSFPNNDDISPFSDHFLRQFFLGHSQGIDYFCAELHADINLDNDLHLVPLKQALSMIYPDQYAMGVKAYSIMLWDKNHQFCGRCSAPTVHPGTQFERLCPNCKLSFFPRISPSVIVLIHRNEELVMARSPHYATGVYGLIAGFVEVGESLEETIHREIKEEIGLQVKNISYFGSQPWPFPDSLMLGFTAEYDSGELVIDNIEIEDAGWYRYDNLPGRPSVSISIAATMLDHFIRSCADKYKTT